MHEAPSVAAPAAQAPKASIADELAAIDAARSALAAGRALEIQSLAALRRTAEPRAKATSFVAPHPASPYVQRVRVAAGLPNP